MSWEPTPEELPECIVQTVLIDEAQIEAAASPEGLRCTCAGEFPTMPTCRGHHLRSCPMYGLSALT